MTNESSGFSEEKIFNAPISRRDFLKALGAGAALSALPFAAETEVRGEKEGSPFDLEIQREALRFVASTPLT